MKPCIMVMEAEPVMMAGSRPSWNQGSGNGPSEPQGGVGGPDSSFDNSDNWGLSD